MNFQRKAILNCKKAADIFWLLGIYDDKKQCLWKDCGKLFPYVYSLFHRLIL